jgi:hypothetical protein
LVVVELVAVSPTILATEALKALATALVKFATAEKSEVEVALPSVELAAVRLPVK